MIICIGDCETPWAENWNSFDKCRKRCEFSNKFTSDFFCNTIVSGGNTKNPKVRKCWYYWLFWISQSANYLYARRWITTKKETAIKLRHVLLMAWILLSIIVLTTTLFLGSTYPGLQGILQKAVLVFIGISLVVGGVNAYLTNKIRRK